MSRGLFLYKAFKYNREIALCYHLKPIEIIRILPKLR